jgi:hypothetical protein
MIPAFERTKIVHALDRAATGIGIGTKLVSHRTLISWPIHKPVSGPYIHITAS